MVSDIKDLSTSISLGSDAVSVKDVFRKEIEGTQYFLLSAYNSLGLFDTLHESAKQRIVTAEYNQSITEQQIMHVLSHSSQAIRDCFSSAVINMLAIYCNTYGQCISSQIIICLSSNSDRNLHIFQEFIDFVLAEFSNKILWEDIMKDCPFYYAIFVERSVFFHLDSQRTGKVSIQDLTSTKMIDDLFEVLLEQKSNQEKDTSNHTASWCSLTNFWRVLEQFRHCDEDWSGMVSLQECHRIKDGTLTPLFLERIFATQTLYGEKSCKEMDFRGFVELDIAIRTRNQSSSIKWLFNILDLRDDGYLDRYEITMMIESMLKNMARLEGYSNFIAEDIVDEVIDMLVPSIQNRISLEDVLKNGMTETAFGILIDYTAFLKYENREDDAGTQDIGL
ncbi:hypothetical protein DICVIV_00863 [Dictyocaulus viviparus]|uniref:EF-hand domain-containing protein n=1 Tax=Dictyocaulus viviparus TaxID=29172 RepID=A0A0D8YAG3_DICVI|nr:hypothetical protein DICVIV_00863 [Dictyocaulus viviparus]